MSHRMLRMWTHVSPVIVNYHIVSDLPLPYVRHLYSYRTMSEFEEDLDFYSRHYTIIGWPELQRFLNGEEKLPPHSLMITFDDGFREVYENAAPALIRKGIPATFFLTSGFIDNKDFNHDNRKSLLADRLDKNSRPVERREIESLLHRNGVRGVGTLEARILGLPYKKRHLIDPIANILEMDLEGVFNDLKPYMTTNQLKFLVDEGFAVGGHSIDHARFQELTLQEQLEQALQSVDFVVNRFGVDYRIFAFPYTDLGISRAFFEAISGQVDATFGTQGFLKDEISFNFQRINGEKFKVGAKQNLSYFYFKKCIKILLKNDAVLRD